MRMQLDAAPGTSRFVHEVCNHLVRTRRGALRDIVARQGHLVNWPSPWARPTLPRMGCGPLGNISRPRTWTDHPQKEQR